MFADKIAESSSTTGTGTFSLAGAVGAYRTWRTGFSTNTVVFYLASNSTGTIWEIGYGSFATGSPDTLTRTLIASSTGSLINWSATPYYIYSIPTAAAMAHQVAGGLAAARPAWAQAGLGWLDHTIGLAVTWVKKRWTGAVDIEEGRFDIVNGLFTPSPRNTWVDNGAAGLTMLATHIGKVILFDTTAAARTFTLLAGASAGIGHGFTCWVLGYGGANGVVLAPNGTEKIDTGTASATLTVPANRLTRLSWDGAKLQWRTDYGSRLTLVGLSETYTAPAITVNVLTINLALGTVFNVANNANISTFTISNAVASLAASFTLVLAGNGTAYTQAWGSSVKWAGGTAPAITTTNGKKDILMFFTNDGGTTWFGTVMGQSF